jgi:hypothetical protein
MQVGGLEKDEHLEEAKEEKKRQTTPSRNSPVVDEETEQLLRNQADDHIRKIAGEFRGPKKKESSDKLTKIKP